jgi:4-carboxymuconolactone decarboxylase
MDQARRLSRWPQRSRVALLAPDELRGASRVLHETITGGPRGGVAAVPIVDEGGRLLGPFRVMLSSPVIGDAVQALGAALRFHGSLTVRTRELAILTVAAELCSSFEWWAHERAGEAAGLSAEQLEALIVGEVPSGLDPAERLAVGVARALARDRALHEDDYQAAIDTLGEAALAELTWLVGYYSMLALSLAVFAPPNPLAGDPPLDESNVGGLSAD